MDSVKDELSKNLSYYRKIKKITQKELADKLGVKHNTVSGWENGANSIDVEVLFNICKTLDISINDIYGEFALPNRIFSVYEQEIIKKYRALDERGKQTIDVALNSQYEIILAKKETSTTLPSKQAHLLTAEDQKK